MQPTILNRTTANFNEVPEDQIPVSIPFCGILLHGHLFIPEHAQAVVIISHGSGSSRFNARNSYIARELYDRDIAVLLIDLLTAKEDNDLENRFNVPLLTERMKHVTNWIAQYPGIEELRVGYLGVSTGAAPALQAATEMTEVRAIVCESGRTDVLPDDTVYDVSCPTLLIAGGLDNETIKVNTKTFLMLTCKKSMVIVNSASHLFEEQGKLHVASEVAGNWFEKHLL